MKQQPDSKLISFRLMKLFIDHTSTKNIDNLIRLDVISSAADIFSCHTNNLDLEIFEELYEQIEIGRSIDRDVDKKIWQDFFHELKLKLRKLDLYYDSNYSNGID